MGSTKEVRIRIGERTGSSTHGVEKCMWAYQIDKFGPTPYIKHKNKLQVY